MGSTNSSLGFYKPKEERKGEIIKHMPATAMHVILLTCVFFRVAQECFLLSLPNKHPDARH
jgi:hypothetical protein